VAPLHCLIPPELSTERIAHLGAAEDCRAAAFQSSLCPSWVNRVDFATSARGRLSPQLRPKKRTFLPIGHGPPSSVTEEYDHARERESDYSGSQAGPLEQGKTDWTQTAATAETCLGHTNQAPDGAAGTRSGTVQSCHR